MSDGGENEIQLTMSKAEWSVCRKALRAYVPTNEERTHYNDLREWIDCDWEDS